MWLSTLYCLPFLLAFIHGIPLEEAEDDVARQLLAQLLLKKNEKQVERPTPYGLFSPAPLSRFLRSQESTLLSLLDPDRLTTHSDHTHVRDEDGRTDTPLGCVGVNCLDDSKISQITGHWTMPLKTIGRKKYYLGIFFKANWYKAAQYCRFHGMHLASIDNAEQNKKLENYIQSFGLGHEHFWTSGTDQGQEGQFVWMATGTPITFTNWNAGEPNNFVYENGEEEHCLELWNRDGKGLKWNDSPCSFETYFVCEVQPQ